MARKARDYKAEYARRIAKGAAEGKTRKQARGHAAEGRTPIGASASEMRPERLPGYLKKLRTGRSVKIMATLESGAVVEIARGRPGPLIENWTEEDAEGGGYEWDRGYRGDDKVVKVQVFYK